MDDSDIDLMQDDLHYFNAESPMKQGEEPHTPSTVTKQKGSNTSGSPIKERGGVEKATTKKKNGQSSLEIAPDKTKEYHTEQKKILYQEHKYDGEIVKICNVKKEFHKCALLLTLWSCGRREWHEIKNCLVDAPTLVVEYVKLGHNEKVPELEESESIKNIVMLEK